MTSPPSTDEDQAIFTDWSDEERKLAALLQQGQAVVLSERKKGPHTHILAWSKARGSHVYVGRRNHYTGHPQSPFANPYSAKKYGREACIELYRQMLLETPALLDQVSDLRGRTLGCWCSPEACHGDVLAALANASEFSTE